MEGFVQVGILILMILYFIAEGATEGYTWASKERRLENKIIKGGKDGKGFLDYHSWRSFETLFALAVGVAIAGWTGLGYSLVGLFIYERILNRVVIKKWFKEDGDIYHILKWDIPRYKWQDWLAFVIGIILIILT